MLQGRAKQLYNAGYKKIEDVARAKPKELVTNIEHMNFRLASQLVSAAKVIIWNLFEHFFLYRLYMKHSTKRLSFISGNVAGKAWKSTRRSSRMHGSIFELKENLIIDMYGDIHTIFFLLFEYYSLSFHVKCKTIISCWIFFAIKLNWFKICELSLLFVFREEDTQSLPDIRIPIH